MTDISKAAFDLIVNEETGGQAYYLHTEQHPDWPGGASGVTIGCGYDCGYTTKEQILIDWRDYLTAPMLAALQSVAGIKGSGASSRARALRYIVTVPWDAALAVFSKIDVPKWTGIVERALPNFSLLSGDSAGALVSLAFNRGASFNLAGDRYSEMRAIKAHMAARSFSAIPAEFRSMKRIWPPGAAGHADLTARREHEAVLFEQGLQGTITRPLPPPAAAYTGVRWVQHSLNDVNNAGLAIDGRLGDETRKAIDAFRTKVGLKPDGGQIDDELCAALDKALAA